MEECSDGTDTAVYRGCWTINSAHLLIYCHCSRDQLPRRGTTASTGPNCCANLSNSIAQSFTWHQLHFRRHLF